jgi:hypothetical protein
VKRSTSKALAAQLVREHVLLLGLILAGVVMLVVEALVEAARAWGAP